MRRDGTCTSCPDAQQAVLVAACVQVDALVRTIDLSHSAEHTCLCHQPVHKFAQALVTIWSSVQIVTDQQQADQQQAGWPMVEVVFYLMELAGLNLHVVPVRGFAIFERQPPQHCK
jgi:hypothetical protein